MSNLNTSLVTSMQPTNGLLLINLGSPSAPTEAAVRSYLKEFLSDPRVMDIPFLVRQMVLRLFILPKRPAKVAPKYRQIWGEQASPLIESTGSLGTKVQALLGENWKVLVAMRYGEPDLEAALESMRAAKLTTLVVLPLFPQYASATTGSVIEKVFKVTQSWKTIPSICTINQFYQHQSLVQGFANRGRGLITNSTDHILFSFHGLPVRHLEESDCTQTCLKDEHCCSQPKAAARGCYKAQCLGTAKSIANELGLEPAGWSTAFQSRLGKDEWIGPNLLDELARLADSGKKNLVVFCPSFVADCLETLEEIAISAQETFTRAGGETLKLVPSLNDDDDWAKGITQIIQCSRYLDLLG